MVTLTITHHNKLQFEGIITYMLPPMNAPIFVEGGKDILHKEAREADVDRC